jgi:hypothetical protein
VRSPARRPPSLRDEGGFEGQGCWGVLLHTWQNQAEPGPLCPSVCRVRAAPLVLSVCLSCSAGASALGWPRVRLSDCTAYHVSVCLSVMCSGTHVLDEAERSLHDALCVLSQTVLDSRVLYGGGWPEMKMAQARRWRGVFCFGGGGRQSGDVVCWRE